MCVEIVSSEYNYESLEDFDPNVDLRQQDTDYLCRSVLGSAPKTSVHLLSKWNVKPAMASCSGSYKRNTDGSWEVTGEIVFTNPEQQSKGKDKGSSNESSSGQETAAKEYDPPDSRDRDHN